MSDTAVSRASGARDTDRLADAVGKLPASEREALVATLSGRRSYREAAAVLGQPEGEIRARIRSGLRRLGSLLAEDATDDAAVVGG